MVNQLSSLVSPITSIVGTFLPNTDIVATEIYYNSESSIIFIQFIGYIHATGGHYRPHGHGHVHGKFSH